MLKEKWEKKTMPGKPLHPLKPTLPPGYRPLYRSCQLKVGDLLFSVSSSPFAFGRRLTECWQADGELPGWGLLVVFLFCCSLEGILINFITCNFFPLVQTYLCASVSRQCYSGERHNEVSCEKHGRKAIESWRKCCFE